MSLQVTDGLTVTILPDSNHEFLMPTKEVAAGYGVSPHTIRFHLSNNSNDFIEGKHFLKGVGISNTLGKNTQPHQVYYTKRGVVRLGFFVKSDRARLFRDWVEDLIIHQTEQYAERFLIEERPRHSNELLDEFDSRVRKRLINDTVYYKVRDIGRLCKVTQHSLLIKRLKSLNNFLKISSENWGIEEWWCNQNGVREFLNTQKNKNFIRLHDALFNPQLSLMGGDRHGTV
ncbi:MAG: hypothetical protein ABFD76_10110 [Smithella sp.]